MKKITKVGILTAIAGGAASVGYGFYQADKRIKTLENAQKVVENDIVTLDKKNGNILFSLGELQNYVNEIKENHSLRLSCAEKNIIELKENKKTEEPEKSEKKTEKTKPRLRVRLENGKDKAGNDVRGITVAEIEANVHLTETTIRNRLNKNIDYIGFNERGVRLYDYPKVRKIFEGYWYSNF